MTGLMHTITLASRVTSFRCPGCDRSWVQSGEIAVFGWETKHRQADGFFLCCGQYRFRWAEQP